MEILRAALFPPVPTVVIEVEREGLEEEESGVQPHRHGEDLCEVAEQRRIDRNQQEDEDAAPNRGGGVGDEQQPRELLRELVVPVLASKDADGLCYDGEHRHAQHESGEQEMHLRCDPHGGPSPDDREIAVVAPRGDLGEGWFCKDEERQRGDPCGDPERAAQCRCPHSQPPNADPCQPVGHQAPPELSSDESLPDDSERKKNGNRFEKSTGRLLLTSAITSRSISV